MGFCVCDISALEVFRASGRLLPDLLERPRTAKLDRCSVLPAAILEGEMVRLGVTDKPYHLLVGSVSQCHRRRSDIVLYTCERDLSPRSIVRLSNDAHVVGPELLFLELASHRTIDELDLACIGYELCGTYVLDHSWDGFTNTNVPMTSVTRIKRFLDRSSNARGVRCARRALDLMLDGAHSPMETIMALLLFTPQRIGGAGFEGARLNYRVMTSDGPKLVDAAFPGLGVGLEYKGRAYHSIEASGRDDRRQNRLVGAGMTILNVWYEDLADERHLDALVHDIARALGVRLRCRRKDYEMQRRLLHHRLLPSIRQFAGE